MECSVVKCSIEYLFPLEDIGDPVPSPQYGVQPAGGTQAGARGILWGWSQGKKLLLLLLLLRLILLLLLLLLLLLILLLPTSTSIITPIVATSLREVKAGSWSWLKYNNYMTRKISQNKLSTNVIICVVYAFHVVLLVSGVPDNLFSHRQFFLSQTI